MTIFRGSFVHNFDYKINGMVLDRVKLVRDLGIYFDSGWTFDNHIEFITSEASKLVGFIKRTTFKWRSVAIVAYLYKALVLPQLLRINLQSSSQSLKNFYDMLLIKQNLQCLI